MANVFISYDSEDSDFAELVDGRLDKAGHKAIRDVDSLNAGEAWRDKLDQAIREAHVMVVITTPDARASEYVTYEWAFALGAEVRVVPVQLKATKPFHPRLDVLQYLDFTNKQRPWEALLLEVEKAAEAQQTTTIAVPAGTPPTIKNAVAALDSLDVGAQVAGVRSLANTDHPAARDALAKALQHPVKSVRMAAAIEFADRKDPRIIPGLIEASQNDDFLRQWFPGRDFRMMYDAYFEFWIEHIGPPAIPQLLEALLDQDRNVRWLGAKVLGRIGETRAVAGLIGVLKDDVRGVRAQASRALGMIGAKEGVPNLVQALGDEAESVRAEAAIALGKIGYNAVSDLLAALEDDSAPVRAAAAEALGELQARPAVPDLLRHLRKDSSRVRAASALALGRIGDPAALTPLIQAFQDKGDKYSMARKAAAQALGLLGDPGAVDALHTYLAERQDQEGWDASGLGLDVAEALLKLKCVDSIALVGKVLGSHMSGRQSIRMVGLLRLFGQSAVPALSGLLNHRISHIHEPSAKILKEIGSAEALAAVEQWNWSR